MAAIFLHIICWVPNHHNVQLQMACQNLYVSFTFIYTASHKRRIPSQQLWKIKKQPSYLGLPMLLELIKCKRKHGYQTLKSCTVPPGGQNILLIFFLSFIFRFSICCFSSLKCIWDRKMQTFWGPFVPFREGRPKFGRFIIFFRH